MSTAVATKWVIDPTHSEVSFKIKHLVISTVTGYFREFEGSITTDGEDWADAEVEFKAAALEHSFAGRLGQVIEPVVKPMGGDWKIGVGLIASFAAREVFVSTMGIIYSVEESDDEDETQLRLRDRLALEKHDDGTPVYTAGLCISLMVFFVFAVQCLSTIAVVRRETQSWKWPLFQLAYMTGTGYILAVAAFQISRLFSS